MITKQIGVFIEDGWVFKSYSTIIKEIEKIDYKPVLITTNKDWDNGKRKSISVSNDEPVIQWEVDLSIKDVNIDKFAGFVFGGGYWADRLRWWLVKEKSKGVLELPEPRSLIESILKSQKHFLGVICHSMWILCSLKHAVRAKEVTCAYNIIDDVKNAGFTYVDKDVHVDGNLITGRMSSHSDIFIKEFLYQVKQSIY
ncbi:MAG: DJ-1/PfpI family protein [Spirochaetota bacterium]|nr:DJ-1/PfpI family protein [Spirochaetota bacterium]